ncbi:MAG: hypothetical protein WCF90_07525 [Methanomicrobiales archaeon]
MTKSYYLEIKNDYIPVVTPRKGISIRIICWVVNEIKGPVRDIIADPQYLDVKLGHTAMAYVISGKGTFDIKRGISCHQP